ncbi:MAG: hypothetical protein AVDCRST_MAG42-2522 [uncultured Chthoniobacterales bacterium]|uniref:Uncharacterized protein n=1 Tax=uncultured Chthoniobacterales bacterium TaxID=1836801 RepID=A0A6J4IQ43_9BACT|nr:MAG: hypothetical protein AVDCRST_MAG42-2522 [uncultured Chthoniobacterales bacterium]
MKFLSEARRSRHHAKASGQNEDGREVPSRHLAAAKISEQRNCAAIV